MFIMAKNFPVQIPGGEMGIQAVRDCMDNFQLSLKSVEFSSYVAQRGSSLSSALDDHVCLVWNPFLYAASCTRNPQCLWLEIAFSTAPGVVSQTWEHFHHPRFHMCVPNFPQVQKNTRKMDRDAQQIYLVVAEEVSPPRGHLLGSMSALLPVGLYQISSRRCDGAHCGTLLFFPWRLNPVVLSWHGNILHIS